MRALRLLLPLLLVWLPTLPAFAAGACSADIGKVTLNEYAHQSNYAEIRTLASGVNLSGWKIRIVTAANQGVATCTTGCVERALPATGSDHCGNYQVTAFGSSETPANADVVLLDAADNVVDILRARTASTMTTLYPRPACSYTGPSTDLLNVNSAQKGIDRSPDGVGEWRNTPGTGANSYLTRCGANKPEQVDADLALAKTPTLVALQVGDTATFVLGVTNNGPATATSVAVEEKLPAGLSYVSNTPPSVGTFDPARLIWSIPSLSSGQSGSMTLTVNAQASGTWINSITGASNNLDPVSANNTASATVQVTVPDPAAFNACHDSVDCNATTARLYTRLSGIGFSLNLAALKADGSVETTFGGAPDVALMAGDCAAGSLLQSLGAPTFTGGRLTLSGIVVASAVPVVRVRITHNGNTTCSSDAFAIRPAQFTLASSPVLDNVTLTLGGAKMKAGLPFTLTAAAGVVAGYSGTPVLQESLVTDHNNAALAGGTLLGAFAPGTGAESSGAFAYHNVGALNFLTDAVIDQGFAGVDQAVGDCVSSSASNTPVAGKVGCWTGSAATGLGRFYPDHFSAALSWAPACSAGASAFTYMDQDALGLVFAVRAESATGAVLTGYATGYPILAPLALAADNGGAPVPTSRFAAPGLPPAAWTAGALVFADTLAFSRLLTGPDGPYETLRLGFTANDPDGVLFTLLDGALLATPASSVATASTRVRYGRLRLSNAAGSELLPLQMPLVAQYWGASGWQTNADDQCTTIAAPTLSAFQRALAAGETAGSVVSPLRAGQAPVRLSAPGAGNSGSVRVTVGAPAGLKYRWDNADQPVATPDGDLFDDDPSAVANFGVYRNNFIFMRENY